MNKDYVTHQGIITRVSDGLLTLRTDEACSCDGCAVASLCNKDNPKSHDTLTIDLPDATRFSVGERVEIIASSGSTLRATWWALLLPTLLFVGIILAVRLIWPSSGALSLVAGFVVLGIYDLILYLMRRRLAGRISWSVKRL